ncbi:DUF6504 family protein [Kribbella sp. NBC_00709]|uniref:DUF6504 family protein n=1 Tax=Kribbella sp. NBC_00709 TaxID=2975972 RepID=UPI002E2C2826|nr:DUF6504 family protein [Kribbella sp. NBC_00709]
MWEFDDAVEVHSVFVDGIETPDQFLWRGRLWRVCALRSQWTETAAWWERGIIGTGETYDARAGHAAQSDLLPARIDAAMVAEACSAARTTRPTRIHPAATTTAHPRTTAGVAAAATPSSRAAATLTPERPVAEGASPAAVGVLDADWGPERTVFRVEAGCGRHGRRELFDLAHDPDSGRWQLERVTDR